MKFDYVFILSHVRIIGMKSVTYWYHFLARCEEWVPIQFILHDVNFSTVQRDTIHYVHINVSLFHFDNHLWHTTVAFKPESSAWEAALSSILDHLPPGPNLTPVDLPEYAISLLPYKAMSRRMRRLRSLRFWAKIENKHQSLHVHMTSITIVVDAYAGPTMAQLEVFFSSDYL